MGKVRFRSVSLQYFAKHLDQFFTGEFVWRIHLLGKERFVLVSQTQLAYLKYRKRYEYDAKFQSEIDNYVVANDGVLAEVLWERACSKPEEAQPEIRRGSKGEGYDYHEQDWESFKECFVEALFTYHQYRKVIITMSSAKPENVFYLMTAEAFTHEIFLAMVRYDRELKARLKKAAGQARRGEFVKFGKLNDLLKDLDLEVKVRTTGVAPTARVR